MQRAARDTASVVVQGSIGQACDARADGCLHLLTRHIFEVSTYVAHGVRNMLSAQFGR